MAQKYLVKDVKVGDQWSNSYGTFQSIALALEGIGEPVNINRKLNEDGTYKEISKGEELFGELEEKTSKNGRPYFKFKTVKPEGQSGGRSYGKSKEELDGLAWGNALTNATQLVVNYGGSIELEEAIERTISTAEQLVEGRKAKE